LPYTAPITITTDTVLKTLAVVSLTPGSFEGPANSQFYSSVGVFRYHFDDRPWGNPREIVNTAGMRFRFIPITPHVTTAFYMGSHEVTQAQWDNVMAAEPNPNNPSSLVGASRPVENVSWYDAKRFTQALNVRENTTKYRLPTRKEWEAVAAFYAPVSQTYAHGPVSAQICLSGHYGPFRNWQGTILGHSNIGTLLPNGFGVFDIWGNVSEWVQDLGANEHNRFVCGCAWDHQTAKTCALINSCRQAWPHTTHTNLGFRVASDL
jgi:formylglycine-generating enzyme required for sulfatase activity